ncbi:MAG TPA: PDGLE domain-containing protein [Candidatus Angelobacter sp.]|nr:PDGLE domain-containing protein [Candidatus Angelobacter sp.]
MSRTKLVIGGLVIAALVVVAASLWASGDPDGLERVAEEQGFDGAGQEAPFALIADYVFPGLDGPAATVVAGLLGIVVVFGLVWVVGRALAARRTAADHR